VLRLALGLLVGGALISSGCALLSRDPDPLPHQPFGEFTVSEVGGVDGRYNVLRLRPDGIGIFLSSDPKAGVVNAETMARLENLLGSEEFRLEAAREAPKPIAQCSDQIRRTIQLGDLRMSRESHCQPPEDKPAFDEILRLLDGPLQGRFDRPIGRSAPPLQRLTVERSGYEGPDYRITIGPDGRAELEITGVPTRRRSLTQEKIDALRLLQVGLSVPPEPSPCTRPGSHRITTGSASPLTVSRCMQRYNNLDLWSVISLAQRTFDLD
jgi:hypothetical protein